MVRNCAEWFRWHLKLSYLIHLFLKTRNESTGGRVQHVTVGVAHLHGQYIVLSSQEQSGSDLSPGCSKIYLEQ